MKSRLYISILILIAFLVSSYYVDGQVYSKPSPGLYGITYQRGKFTTTILIPTVCGHPTTLNSTDSSQSAFVYDSCAHIMYFYDPATKDFHAVAGGAATDSLVFATVYRLDTALRRVYTTINSTTGGGKVDSNLYYHAAYFTPGDTLLMNGDSYTQGYTASNPATKGYSPILAANLGAVLQFNPVGGSGALNAYKQILEQTTYDNQKAITWLSGFNDIHLSGDNKKTYEKLKGCLTAALASSFAKDFTPAALGSFSGTWNNYSSDIISKGTIQYSGYQPYYSGTVGDYVTFSSTGDNLVVYTYGTDDVVYPGGAFSVVIDGTLTYNFDNRGLTDGIEDYQHLQNGITPNALIIHGLGTGSHTIVITVTAVSTGGYIYLDGVGTLKTPQYSKAFIVGEVPYMPPTSYSLNAPYNLGSDAITDSANLYYDKALKLFSDYPAYKAKVNSFYNANTGIGSDNIHPSDAGYADIAKAFIAMFAPTQNSSKPYAPDPLIFNNGDKTFIGTYYGGWYGITNNTSMNWTVNRDPVAGTFYNPAHPAAQMSLSEGDGMSLIQFFTGVDPNVLDYHNVRMQIDGYGYIGINTASSYAKSRLEVNGQVSIDTLLTGTTAGTATTTDSVVTVNSNGFLHMVNASVIAPSITGKLNISDTSAMLSAYLTAIGNRVKYSDTAAMLSNYRTGINSNTSNILLKLNLSDSASMLSHYAKNDGTGATGTWNINTNGSVVASSANITGSMQYRGDQAGVIDSVLGKVAGSNQVRTVALSQISITSVNTESAIAPYNGSASVIVSADPSYPGIYYYSTGTFTPTAHFIIAATGIGSGYWLYRYTPYSGLSGLPTTLAGYGITDATKFKTVASYALMIADGTPSVATLYEVITDENKSYSRSTYIWKPNGNREWIASTTDN